MSFSGRKIFEISNCNVMWFIVLFGSSALINRGNHAVRVGGRGRSAFINNSAHTKGSEI